MCLIIISWGKYRIIWRKKKAVMTLTYASQTYNTTLINNEKGDSYQIHCTGSCCKSGPLHLCSSGSAISWSLQGVFYLQRHPSRHLSKSSFLIGPSRVGRVGGSDTLTWENAAEVEPKKTTKKRDINKIIFP